MLEAHLLSFPEYLLMTLLSINLSNPILYCSFSNLPWQQISEFHYSRCKGEKKKPKNPKPKKPITPKCCMFLTDHLIISAKVPKSTIAVFAK